MNKVNKAVIIAAGRGTRFLPFTKAVPKELLPVVDTPAIQLIAEEIVNAGIRDILIVDSEEKKAIRNHFTQDPQLAAFLKSRGKYKEEEALEKISEMANFTYVSQKEATGSADAVYLAKEFANHEPIAVLNGDDVMEARQHGVTAQLKECFEANGNTVIGVQEVAREQIRKYGAIRILSQQGRTYRIDSIVEKPQPSEAPSFMAALGRYVISADFFGFIDRTPIAANGEHQFTDALKLQAKEQGIFAYEFEGKRYDLGDKFGFLQANVESMLQSAEYGETLRRYLTELMEGWKK